MQWATREFVHFDRVATPWLILRFVDPEAEFLFLPWGREDERPAAAMPFAIPGVELSDHDADGSTFVKVLRKYGLATDPALTKMAALIDHGVAETLWNRPPPPGDRAGAVMAGVLAVAEGIMLSSSGDSETITRALPLFDGLYANFSAEALLSARNEPVPAAAGPSMWRTVFFAAISKAQRAVGKAYDGHGDFEQGPVFEATLKAMRDHSASYASSEA